MTPMLEWPKRTTKTAQRVLDRFKATAAAEELEEDVRAWRVVSWSWNEEPPIRVIARSEKGDEVTYYAEPNGVWTLRRKS